MKQTAKARNAAAISIKLIFYANNKVSAVSRSLRTHHDRWGEICEKFR